MFVSFPSSAPRIRRTVKALMRPGVQVLREMPVHAAHMRQAGRGPLAVFLPAYGKTGAALLRIYNMAAALRPLGWRTVVLPPTLSLGQRGRLLAQLAPDVLVMQGARHELNRPALYPGVPVVFDMDDADFHLPHLADAVRRAMADVALVTAGSSYIANWCRAQGAPSEVVWTGTPVSDGARVPAARRAPVVAWAQTRPMTYTREAALVADAMGALAVRHPGVTLRLYDRQAGDDPAFLGLFRAPGLRLDWRETMDYAGFLGSFDDVALGLAPLCPETPFSRGKSFGKVLGYLDRAVPVIGSDACEHGAFFTPETGVITNDPGQWVAAMARLLDAPGDRQVMAAAAFGRFRQQLSLAAVARRMSTVLSSVITSGARVADLA